MSIIEVKSNGVSYLRLVESFSEYKNGKTIRKYRVVKHLGSSAKYDDGKPDFLQRLRESFKKGEPIIDELQEYVKLNQTQFVTVKFDRNRPSECEMNPKIISDFILDPIFNQLGITDVLRSRKSKSKLQYDLAGIVKLLTYGRIIDPDSKFQTAKQNERYLIPPAHNLQIQDIYKALDELNDLSLPIQKRMNTKITNSKIGRKTEHVFYDVTNYYFETALNDPDIIDEETGEITKKGFRKKGVSKEHRPEPIVQMGLFIDENGIPISHKLFPGNTHDQTTFRPSLRETIDNYSLGRVIVVADRGLNNGPNIAHLLAQKNGFVISKSLRKNTPETRKWILDQTGYSTEKDDFTGENDVKFKVKSRIVERKIKDENGHEISFQEKQVVYWSKAHFLREAQQNQAFMDYISSVIEFPDKIKDKQAKIEHYLRTLYVDPETGEILKVKKVREVNESKVQEYLDLMGYYLITTSEIEKSDSEIINIYHRLSRIEDNFRITKSDLQGRPIFVWTENHINAHFLICFIALTIIRIIQNMILQSQNKDSKVKLRKVHGESWWESGITAGNLQTDLNNLVLSELPAGMCLLSKMPGSIAKLCEHFNVDFPAFVPSISQLKQFKYQLNKEICI
jgi:transposase